jgi:hypothetical protein
MTPFPSIPPDWRRPCAWRGGTPAIAATRTVVMLLSMVKYMVVLVSSSSTMRTRCPTASAKVLRYVLLHNWYWRGITEFLQDIQDPFSRVRDALISWRKPEKLIISLDRIWELEFMRKAGENAKAGANVRERWVADSYPSCKSHGTVNRCNRTYEFVACQHKPGVDIDL